MRQHKGSSDVRVPGERYFARGGEYPHACRTREIFWRQHKRRFAVAKFNGNLLHLFTAHTFSIKDNGDWVAEKRRIRKNICNDIASFHYLFCLAGNGLQ
ncbi:Uncharacterised protein [Enterobacter cloacae]|nr:Uncharacterised protein [Enterobacter cloacae]